jgi:hypothetical protein
MAVDVEVELQIQWVEMAFNVSGETAVAAPSASKAGRYYLWQMIG